MFSGSAFEFKSCLIVTACIHLLMHMHLSCTVLLVMIDCKNLVKIAVHVQAAYYTKRVQTNSVSIGIYCALKKRGGGLNANLHHTDNYSFLPCLF